MIQQNDAFLELAMIADRIHPREFIDTVIELYSYDTEVGPISYVEFQALVGEGQTVEDRMNRMMVREEAEAFAAYLHTIRRNRLLSSLLIQKLRDDSQTPAEGEAETPR